MGGACLNCGKPLGSRMTLCYRCDADGICPEDILSVDEAVKDRVERYLIISSTRCAQCGGLHGTVTVDGDQYTAADFGIDSLDDLAVEMDKEEQWIREHREEVGPALSLLEADWPRSVSIIRRHLL